MVAADVEFGDAGDGRHEDDSEERADVEDEDLILEGPGEREKEQDADGKEDVAADFGAGALLVGGKVVGCGDGQASSPWDAACWMQFSVRFCGLGGGVWSLSRVGGSLTGRCGVDEKAYPRG
jgi:hypothetical protein